jgi:tetratricopeptide (TPR) repeat protein
VLTASARSPIPNAGKAHLEFGARRGIVRGVAVTSILLLLGSLALAQSPPRVKNIELCNGAERTSQSQINGCTALIDSGNENPNVLAIAYNNRGNAYASKGDYDRAIEDYGQSIKLNPAYAKPLNNRGITYYKKGDYDRAIKDFDEALKLNPHYANAFANRAQAYQKKNDYERATGDYDEAIRFEPNLETVWNGRCWVRAILGELQAALADCNNALQLKPNDAATYDSRGLVYLKMGQFDPAIDDYTSALRIQPNLASALYGRGLAKIRKSDTAGGNADMAAAKAIDAKIVDDFARYAVQ